MKHPHPASPYCRKGEGIFKTPWRVTIFPPGVARSNPNTIADHQRHQ